MGLKLNFSRVLCFVCTNHMCLKKDFLNKPNFLINLSSKIYQYIEKDEFDIVSLN